MRRVHDRSSGGSKKDAECVEYSPVDNLCGARPVKGAQSMVCALLSWGTGERRLGNSLS